MSRLLSIYHRLPYPLKVAAANLKGFQLRRWRYGKETEQLVAETQERESWSASDWQRWQEAQLEFILHRAATQVPYYRDYWQKQRRKNNRLAWNYLENWPILEKEIVRNNPQAFIADDKAIGELYVDHTSGTTGKQALIYESRATVKQWYALSEARIRRWHQVSYQDHWGMFGGQKIIPVDRMEPPFWITNYSLQQRYFSIFHITRETTPGYVQALHKFAPSHLIGYPSILAVLAYHILELGLPAPALKVIICNSEQVLEHQRKLMVEAFKCPVIETYGMAEITAAASECTAGTLHTWPEAGILEVYHPEEAVYVNEKGIEGDFVMTGLLNPDMPLIRYRNGDRGSLPDWEARCECGRSLPRFGSIQGRTKDLIRTADGRKLYILDSIFNGLPIVEAQLIQESLSSFVVKLVPLDHTGSGLAELDAKISKILRPYLGDAQITIIPLSSIPRNSNGKFQPFVSRLSAENHPGQVV